MIKRILLLGLIGVTVHLFGQVISSELYIYPKGQEAYTGGEVQFYKDFHQILIDKKLKPCENKSEFYYLKVLVNENSTVNYVKEETDTEMETKNKCAHDLSLEVLEHMDRWNPVIVDGVKKKAVSSFFIFPDALFENYKEAYVPEVYPASFESLPGGINKFREEVARRIDLRGFEWKSAFKLVVIFVVERDGRINDIKLEQSSGIEEFDNRIIEGIKSVRKKWTPGKINGVPVRYRFRLPLNFGPPQ